MSSFGIPDGVVFIGVMKRKHRHDNDRRPARAWLFVNRERRIYIASFGECEMSVCRPGVGEVRYEFRDERQMRQFQVVLAEQLTETGWILLSGGPNLHWSPGDVQRRTRARKRNAAVERASANFARDAQPA